MTDLTAWIATRTPGAPAPLQAWVTRALEGSGSAEQLLTSGIEALDRARAQPGRVRSSAFELLGADALLTYASEASLDDADPRHALKRLIRATAAPRR